MSKPKRLDETGLSYLISKIKSTFWPKSDVVEVDLADVAMTGDYGDLINKPTIPSIVGLEETANKVTSLSNTSTNTQYPSAKAVYDIIEDIKSDIETVDEVTASALNDLEERKYEKPAGGIPSSDMASAVQTSLGKADTAVQDVSGKEDKANKVTSLSAQSTDTQYPSAKCIYDVIEGVKADAATIDEVTATALNDLEEKKYEKPVSGIPASDLASGVIPDISGKEDKSNKVTSLSSGSTDTQYPSAKCVYDMIGDVESLLASI